MTAFLDEPFDPYLIPGTRVLKNLLGTQDRQVLSDFESEMSALAVARIRRDLPRAEGTVAQLQRIHRILFRRVYPWAGEIRTINMSKGGGQPFHYVERMDMGIAYCESTLRVDNLFKGMTRDQLIERLSVNYDNFNTLHPFREGNGRTQRLFWELVLYDAGWHFDWGLVNRQINDMASIAAAENLDYSKLESMFYTIVRPLDEPLLAGPDLRMLSDDEYRTQSNVGRTLNAEEYQRLDRKYSLEPAGTDKTLKQAPTKQMQQNAEMRLSDSMKSGLKRRGRSSRQ